MYILYDNNKIIRAVSTSKIYNENYSTINVKNDRDWFALIYKKLPADICSTIGLNQIKKHKDIKIAFVCNWKDRCGISTYSKFLIDSLKPKVKEITIFSEDNKNEFAKEEMIIPCWQRGENLSALINNIKKYKPDFVIIQHEYGIFPNAFKFMQLIQSLETIPYVVVMHSVYRHLDKAVYSECAKNIIVHSEEGKSVLREMGNTNNVYTVPHGCLQFKNTEELWNICINPYTIMQFGFGFSYKGVDRAFRAISQLKSTDKKYEDIQYLYLCSTNSHSLGSNREYCNKLMLLAKELDIIKNIVILQKYQTDEMINLFLRLTKIAIFPYVIDPNNEVFGASGAIRVAIANKRPVIASESHLFDDLEGILPRPKNHIELANEINKIFNSKEYAESLIEKSFNFVLNNSWNKSADKYLEVYDDIINRENNEIHGL